MTGRGYQTEQIELLSNKLSVYDKVIVQLPTGGGKTVEFCLIAKSYIARNNDCVLILVHRKELMKQAARTIEKTIGIKPHLITSETKSWHLSRIYIGMVESTVKRLNLFSEIGLVIIDESHIANFNKIHHLFIGTKIIGFSATPISSSKKDPLNKYYKDIVCGPQINELINLGFLSQNITRAPKAIVDYKKFEIDKRKGDYNEKQMSDEFRQSKHIFNTVKYYMKFCRGKKTIVFNVSKEHSREVTEKFQLFGFNAKNLDSDCSEQERENILEWFHKTEDAILCNVMIATVGFDEPTIQSVILNFSTTSLVKFIQCCGRGSRKIEGKEFFDIIDMGGNCAQFGDWNDDRDWEYIFNNPEKPSEGVAPVKECPSCEGIVHAATRICPLTNSDGDMCCHEFKIKEIAKEQDLHETILITKGIDIDKIIGANKKKYEYFTFFELAKDVVDSMFENNTVIDGDVYERYFNAYYSLCIDWYKKTLAGKNGAIKDISNSEWHIKRARYNFGSLSRKHAMAESFSFEELKNAI